MRILSAGIQHETNTFAITPTSLADFQRDSGCSDDFQGGQFLKDLYRGTGSIHGGYVDRTEELGIELDALFCARAQPAGKVQQGAFDSMMSSIVDRLRAALPADGILLDLHGAMVTDDFEDAESAILRAVREVVGNDMPIVTTLDLHANISAELAELSDVLIGFDTYPHVDMHERGVEAVDVLTSIIRGDIKPVQAYEQLPLMTLPPKQCTLIDPMKSLMSFVAELEQRPGIVTATVSMGFPFADIKDVGVSVLVTANDDAELAKSAVQELRERVWDLRDALQPDLMPVDELISLAKQPNDGLIIYADGSDNPGGGAPCDGTVILRALIEQQVENAVVGVLFDPETVEAAIRAGVGNTFAARIGAKTDDRHGSPVEATAYVKTLGDGRFTYRGPMRQGLPEDLGHMAVLVVGGVEVVLASQRMQLLDREMLRCVGVTPERKRLIVVKSAVHFRADFGSIATSIIDADTPGIHRPDFGNYDYKNVRRLIYPLDGNV